VRDRFLDGPSLIALVRRHDPAASMAQWLSEPANSQLLGQQLARAVAGVLEMVQDEQVERWLKRTLRAAMARVDLRQSVASVLAMLTHGDRHQAVLDDADCGHLNPMAQARASAQRKSAAHRLAG
jgi:uncharacterized membrane-anchored protein YjiN (DUF445 family)